MQIRYYKWKNLGTKTHKNHVNETAVCSLSSNGKIFIYTIKLRNINDKILVLIKEINLKGNEELKSSSLDLIEHLDEWISIWDKEKNIRTPSNDDEFIFNGYKKYPKNFENLLIQHSIKLNVVE